MKIRQARKILGYGKHDQRRWGSPHSDGTRRRALKRVEQWLGGYSNIIQMGEAMGLGWRGRGTDITYKLG